MSKLLSFKSTIAASIVLTNIVACMPRSNNKSNQPGAGSALKTVTINQPDFAKEMKATLSEEQRKAVIETLAYTISIKAVTKEGKNECNESVTPTEFTSDVTPIATKTFETLKVKRGCNYMLSMNIGKRSDDGKSLSTRYLATWDQKFPSILTKEDLEKANPVAKVSLYVTSAGKEFWDAEVLETLGDTDASIDAGIAKKIKVRVIHHKFTVDKTSKLLKASVEASTINKLERDLYCGILVNARFGAVNALPTDPVSVLTIDPSLKALTRLFQAKTDSNTTFLIDLTAPLPNIADALLRDDQVRLMSSAVYCAATKAEAEGLMTACMKAPELKIESLPEINCEEQNAVSPKI
jgi:hypothetical protein